MENNFYLMGYYFSDSNFDNLLFMAPTEGEILNYSKDIVEELFDKNITSIQTIRWLGKIRVDIDGMYEFSINDNVLIGLNNTILSSKLNKIKLEKDITYNIRIEQKLSNSILLKDFVLQILYFSLVGQKVKTVDNEKIYSLDFSRTDEITFISSDNFFESKSS